MPNPENLKPLTSSKARKIGRKGGIKSGEVRREKRLLSMIYAEALSNEHNLAGTGKSLKSVVEELLAQGNVPMFKEVREATEGSKVALMNPDGSELLSKGISVNFIESIPEKKDASKPTE